MSNLLISKTVSIPNLYLPKISSKNNTLNYDLKQDIFEKDEPCKDSAKIQCSTNPQKNTLYLHRFDKKEQHILDEIISKDNKKIEDIKNLSSRNFIKNDLILRLAKYPQDLLNAIVPFAVAKSKNDKKPKYSRDELSLLYFIGKKRGVKNLVDAQSLINTSLSTKNIIELATLPDFHNKKDLIVSKILETEKMFGDNLSNITFSKNTYNNSEYEIRVSTKDNQLNIHLFDKNLGCITVENMVMYQDSNGNKYQIKKINDLKNNIASKIKVQIDKYKSPIITDEIRVIRDKDNNIIRKEYTSLSDIEGIYNIKHVYPTGEEKIISSVNKDKTTGVTTIIKDMESFDGTKTNYYYQDDPAGRRIYDYKITDKKGNILLNNNCTFDVINENEFISTKNNEKYKIKINKNTIKIADCNNSQKTTTIFLNKQVKNDKKTLLNILKQLPGEELLKLKNSTKELSETDDIKECVYNAENKTIKTLNNLYTILHELGHAVNEKDINFKDFKTYNKTRIETMSYDKDLQKIYKKERKAYIEAFPDAQRDYIDYFINSVAHLDESNCINEIIAETNALLTTPKAPLFCGIRTQYLQNYFPRTIAKINELLNNQTLKNNI